MSGLNINKKSQKFDIFTIYTDVENDLRSVLSHRGDLQSFCQKALGRWFPESRVWLAALSGDTSIRHAFGIPDLADLDWPDNMVEQIDESIRGGEL